MKKKKKSEDRNPTGRKLTVRQRKLIESYRNYNSDNWLINKDTSSEMHIIHRKKGTKKVLHK